MLSKKRFHFSFRFLFLPLFLITIYFNSLTSDIVLSISTNRYRLSRELVTRMRDNREDMRAFMRKFHRLGHFRGYGGLKLLVLYILSEGPKNGAELMDTIDMMSHGHWKPSPGSIYPLLSKAVEDNLIMKREDRTYELTDAGFEEISMFKTEGSEKAGSIEGILTEIDSNLSYLEDLSGEKLAPYVRMLERIGQKINHINETIHNSGKET